MAPFTFHNGTRKVFYGKGRYLKEAFFWAPPDAEKSIIFPATKDCPLKYTKQELLAAIRRPKADIAPGPDGAPNRILQACAEEAVRHANAPTRVPDWSNFSSSGEQTWLQKVEIVLSADPLDSPLQPTWLANRIERFLNKGHMARTIVELRLREAYIADVEEFKMTMEGNEVGLR